MLNYTILSVKETNLSEKKIRSLNAKQMIIYSVNEYKEIERFNQLMGVVKEKETSAQKELQKKHLLLREMSLLKNNFEAKYNKLKEDNKD